MASRNIHFEKYEMYHKMKEYILRLQIQESSSFMSVAPFDIDPFDKKLQDWWVLLIRLLFSYKGNCRTLAQSYSAILFFDKLLRCSFVILLLLTRNLLEKVVPIYILSNFVAV